MANPKHRTSKSKRDSRRSHWKLALPSISECPQCYEPRLPHRACLVVDTIKIGKSSK